MKKALKKLGYWLYLTFMFILGLIGVYFLYMGSGCESGAYCG